MSHLDTAYKLGALQAMEDFKVELSKHAGPGDVIPPPSPTPNPVQPGVGKGIHNVPGTAPMPAPKPQPAQ